MLLDAGIFPIFIFKAYASFWLILVRAYASMNMKRPTFKDPPFVWETRTPKELRLISLRDWHWGGVRSKLTIFQSIRDFDPDLAFSYFFSIVALFWISGTPWSKTWQTRWKRLTWRTYDTLEANVWCSQALKNNSSQWGGRLPLRYLY